jgi:hypothetical protein
MKFLGLAYGDEDGWNSLSEGEKREVLTQDAVIRDQGNLMSAVQTKVTSVKNWDRNLEVTDCMAFAAERQPWVNVLGLGGASYGKR